MMLIVRRNPTLGGKLNAERWVTTRPKISGCFANSCHARLTQPTCCSMCQWRASRAFLFAFVAASRLLPSTILRRISAAKIFGFRVASFKRSLAIARHETRCPEHQSLNSQQPRPAVEFGNAFKYGIPQYCNRISKQDHPPQIIYLARSQAESFHS